VISSVPSQPMCSVACFRNIGGFPLSDSFTLLCRSTVSALVMMFFFSFYRPIFARWAYFDLRGRCQPKSCLHFLFLVTLVGLSCHGPPLMSFLKFLCSLLSDLLFSIDLQELTKSPFILFFLARKSEAISFWKFVPPVIPAPCALSLDHHTMLVFQFFLRLIFRSGRDSDYPFLFHFLVMTRQFQEQS